MTAPSPTSAIDQLDARTLFALNNRGLAYGAGGFRPRAPRTSIRPSGSIRNLRRPTTTAASPTHQGRRRPRDRRLRPGHQGRPEQAVAFNIRGLAYRAKGDTDRAIADFDQAIRSMPVRAWPSTTAPTPITSKRAFERAIADFDQAIGRPEQRDGLQQPRPRLRDKRDYERAVADFEQAIRSIRNAAAFNNRGFAYCDQDDRARRSPTTIRRSSSIPITPLAYYQPRHRLLRKRDYDRAIADFDQAIKLDPNCAVAYHDRGLAYRDKGDNDRAIADFDQAIKLDPKSLRPTPAAGSPRATAANTTARFADSTPRSGPSPFSGAYNDRCWSTPRLVRPTSPLSISTRRTGLFAYHAMAYNNLRPHPSAARGDIYFVPSRTRARR